jgi:hypothetical protein
MGASASIVKNAPAPLKSSSQRNASDVILCSQCMPSSGSGDPILVVYVYADPLDNLARSAADEFAKQHIPILCDMAASRGVSLFLVPVSTLEQLLDANDASCMFSERCFHSLLAFASETAGVENCLPPQLPLAFVQRCISALKVRRSDAAEFVCSVLKVPQPSSSVTSCFSSGF